MSAGADSRLRILVCEDAPHIARLLQLNLERRGHCVVLAHDGRKGIEIISGDEKGFDLVVTDTRMPKADGYQVVTWVRTYRPSVQVTVLLSDGDDYDDWAGRDHRADKYVFKPMNPVEVIC